MLNLSYWGILSLVALVPFETSFLTVEGLGASVTRLVGLGILVAWVAETLILGKTIKFGKAMTAITLFCVWAGLSLAWAWDKEIALLRLRTVVQLPMLAFLVLNCADSPGRIKSILMVLLMSCFLASALGLVGAGEYNKAGQLSLKGSGAKEYASYAGVVVLIAGLRGAFGSWKLRSFALAMAGVGAVAILASGERGVVVALALALAAVGFAQRWKVSTAVAVCVAGLLVATSLVIAVRVGWVPPAVIERFTVEDVVENGGGGRMDIWKTGARVIRDNPLCGVGLDNFPKAISAYSGMVNARELKDGTGAHADWMELLVCLGAVGFLVFCTSLTITAHELIRRLRREVPDNEATTGIMVLGLLVYVIVVGLTTVYVWRKVYWVGIGLAIAYSLSQIPAGLVRAPSAIRKRNGTLARKRSLSPNGVTAQNFEATRFRASDRSLKDIHSSRRSRRRGDYPTH